MPWRPRLKPLLLALTATAFVATLLAVTAAPQAARWWQARQQLQRLTDGDAASFERSLRFIAQHADDRPGFRDAVVERMDRLDDARFGAAVNALDFAGVWTRDAVGDAAWLRRLDGLARSPDASARVAVGQGFAELDDLAGDARVVDAVSALMRDADPRVRMNALTAVGRLAKHAPDAYRDELGHARRDDHPAIARRAAILSGLLDAAATGASANAALLDADPLLSRYFADPQALAAQLGIADAPFDLPADATPDALRRFLVHRDAAVRHVAAVVAAQRFDAERLTPLARDLLVDVDDDARLGGAVLCGVAGLTPQAITGGLARALADRPGLTRDAALAMDDDALADLGLRRVDALHARWQQEDDWPRWQAYRLALATRGDLPADDAPTADELRLLLLRDDLPKETVLLTMLRLGHADAAWTWLFNPAGEPPIDLDDLLCRRRWWFVLREHPPRAATHSAPPSLWPDAPPPLRRFQLDVLREWTLLNAE